MPDSTTPNNLPLCVCTEAWHGMTVVISCSGTVDLFTADELERQIATALIKQPSAMVIDLTDVDFLASRGMSVLIDTHEQLAATIPLAVVADGPATSRPMTLIGLTDIITVRATLAAAFDELKVGNEDARLRQ
jgi:anti-sigma B factor antagonist